MLILNEEHILDIGIDWRACISVMEAAVRCIARNDYAQPVKPYLRYRNRKNRMIAMPAFVGGSTNMAGIKWIASFPDNIDNGLPRAHSVTILNNADTGVPLGIITTALLSILRTASVSGLVASCYDRVRKPSRVKIGIVGFGPIGRHHLKMCLDLFGDRIDWIRIYDIRPNVDEDFREDDRILLTDSWEEAYADADIFIACTVADAPYIDRRPKPGSLHLNVSLRDYKPAVYDWFRGHILVDDWEEVCRENTDIERMHLEKGLQREDTRTIVDIVVHDCIADFEPESCIFFNPMGMAIFDIALGSYYYRTERSRLINS